MRIGFTGKILIVAVAIIYCFTPYTVKRMNGGCTCGCAEFICHCCRSAEHPCDMTPEMECNEDTIDESYEQGPTLTAHVFQLAVTLDPVGMPDSSGGGSALAGYRDPLMKPPRSI
jgi:hypothetical protein